MRRERHLAATGRRRPRYPSPRMLIYYFGSRKRLLFDAMEEREFLMASWRWYSSKRREPYLRLMFELYGLAFVNPKRFQAFLTAMTEDYFSMIEEGLRSQGLPPRDSRMAATIYRATFRGLLMDLLSTGDRARIDEAIRTLAKRLEREVIERTSHRRRRSLDAPPRR